MIIKPKDFFNQGAVSVVGSDHDSIEQVSEKQPNYFQRVWNQYKSSAQNIIDDVKAAGDKKMNPLSVGLQTAGEVAKSAFTPIVEIPGVKKATEKVLDATAKVSDTLSGRDLKKDIGDVTTKYEDWKKDHPEAAGNLEAAVNVTSLLTGNAAGKEAENVAKQGAGEIVEKGGNIVSKAGKITKTTGQAISESAITPNVKEAEQLLRYKAEHPFLERVSNTLKGVETPGKPITRSTTAFEKGLKGTEAMIGVEAKRQTGELWKNTIEPALKSSTATMSKRELFNPIISRIEGISEPGLKQAYQDAFDAIKGEYKSVTKFDMPTAQKIKEELARFTPDKVFRGKPIANEYRQLQADMASAIRNKIYGTFKDINIKKDYLDYANLKELEKIGVKAISESGLKGGFGNFWSTMYDMATTPIKTVGGQTMYKVGEALEFVGEKGIKKFGDFLKSRGFTVPDNSGPYDDSQVLKSTKEFVKNPKIGLSIEDVSNKLPKVHPEDRQLMEMVIDKVRLKEAMSPELELAASRIAEHYGIKIGKNMNSIANAFDEVLAKFKQTYAPKRSKVKF